MTGPHGEKLARDDDRRYTFQPGRVVVAALIFTAIVIWQADLYWGWWLPALPLHRRPVRRHALASITGPTSASTAWAGAPGTPGRSSRDGAGASCLTTGTTTPPIIRGSCAPSPGRYTTPSTSAAATASS
ncbi:hypothetical protein QP028_04555 [Corynebacterium suedekumii]|nr:hypothetical protein QP028_04555 [Corynebacterium suedekumii]